MVTLGFILLIVGAILFYGAKIIYKKNKKNTLDYKPGESSSNEEFLALVNNGVIVVRIIGALLVVAGGIFILFSS